MKPDEKRQGLRENYLPTFLSYDMHRIENDASNNSPFAACEFVATVTFTEPFSRNDRGIHAWTHILAGGNYELYNRDGLRCHDTHTEFH
jgi:hypothetical protein